MSIQVLCNLLSSSSSSSQHHVVSSRVSSSAMAAAAVPISRLDMNPIALNLKSYYGFSVVAYNKRVANAMIVSGTRALDIGDSEPEPEPELETDDDEVALAFCKMPLDAKLQLKLERKLKMKFSKKIRLRGKKLLHKRRMRKKVRCPPSKLKNV